MSGDSRAARRRATRTAALFLLLASAPGSASPTALTAQEVRGFVLDSDSVPVTGALVELHRITEDSGAVADSTRSAVDGGFRFTIDAGPDSGAVFLPSVRYRGILYWGNPVHGGGVAGDPELQTVTVFDTAVVAGPSPDQPVSMRHVIITPLASGLQVEEVIDLPGRESRTLVAEGDAGLWHASLAADAHGVLASPGGVPEETLELTDGTVTFRGVLPPSGVRIAIGYFVSADRYALQVDHSTERLEVMVVEAPELEVEVTGLRERAPDGELGMAVRRFSATGLARGDRVSLRAELGAPGRGAAGVWFGVACVLAAGAVVSVVVGRRSAPA